MYPTVFQVNEDSVYTCVGHPLPSDITNIVNWSLNLDFSSAFKNILELKTLKGLSLQVRSLNMVFQELRVWAWASWENFLLWLLHFFFQLAFFLSNITFWTLSTQGTKSARGVYILFFINPITVGGGEGCSTYSVVFFSKKRLTLER